MNISLIGMPSCGKTTTAIEIKELLTDYKLIDTDKKIVEHEKRSINDIFEKNGEIYFRKIESKILKDVLTEDNQIISTGGGIIKSDENITLLKENSIVFYLKADIETLQKRAEKESQRPLLNNCNIREKLSQLLNEREKRYMQAHYTIDINKKSPKETALEIIKKINENS